MRRFLAWATFGLLLAFVPARAFADTTVIVLGIQSIEGDDDFARDLTGAIRHASEQVRGWNVSDREVSLSQMIVVHGCSDADAACMAAIAQALSAQRIIYGTVRRTSTGANYRFSVTVSIFNSESGGIENTVTDAIPREQAEIDFLRQRVRRYVTQLAGTPQVGSIAVRSSVPEAQVSIDGTPSGTTAGGAFTATGIESGPHVVEVSAEGYRTFTHRVNVEVGAQAEVDATLEAVSDGGGHEEHPGGGFPFRPVIGWTAIGIGAVFGALSLFEAFTINSWNSTGPEENSRVGQWQQYRNAVPQGMDACEAARAGMVFAGNLMQRDTAKDVCDSADSMQTLQWVFAGISVAALAGGAVLLLIGGGGDDSPAERDPNATARLREPRLMLSPSIGPEGGSLSATLRF